MVGDPGGDRLIELSDVRGHTPVVHDRHRQRQSDDRRDDHDGEAYHQAKALQRSSSVGAGSLHGASSLPDSWLDPPNADESNVTARRPPVARERPHHISRRPHHPRRASLVGKGRGSETRESPVLQERTWSRRSESNRGFHGSRPAPSIHVGRRRLCAGKS